MYICIPFLASKMTLPPRTTTDHKHLLDSMDQVPLHKYVCI